jgi:raffinose/stachyose/melibiose transport system permease protein
MLFVSLKSAKEALLSPNTIPKNLKISNYFEAWKIMNFHQPLFNSLFITALADAGVVIFSAMAAYILAKTKSKSKFKWNIWLYYFFVAGIMIPFYTSLIPIVKIMTTLNLNNSRIGLAIAYMGKAMPMALFFYFGFVEGVPNSIMESAYMDGAGKWTIFWRILFPILKPITTTIIILDSLWFWNDFLFPNLMLTSRAIRTIPLSQYFFYAEYGTRWELAFAAYVIAMIPVLILYIFGQKNIIKGISAGAVKG